MSRPNEPTLDSLDRAIIDVLHTDPQCSIRELARLTGVAENTASARLDSLVADRMIAITVQRDIRTAGFNMVGLVDVTVQPDQVQSIADKLGGLPTSIAVTIFPDEPQLLVFLATRDLDHFLQVVSEDIGSAPGVTAVETSVGLKMLLLKRGIADV